MMRIKVIGTMLQFKSGRRLLEERCVLPQISSNSKYSLFSKKNKNDDDDDDDDYDKPIKFSTSKAAKFRAAYTTAAAQGRPECQSIVISLSLMVFFIYFGILREENDIDENIVKNMPPEIFEQIYGKQETSKYK